MVTFQDKQLTSVRYYSLYIATNLTAGLIYFFFLPETVSFHNLSSDSFYFSK
jgi:hypothetical protein